MFLFLSYFFWKRFVIFFRILRLFQSFCFKSVLKLKIKFLLIFLIIFHNLIFLIIRIMDFACYWILNEKWKNNGPGEPVNLVHVDSTVFFYSQHRLQTSDYVLQIFVGLFIWNAVKLNRGLTTFTRKWIPWPKCIFRVGKNGGPWIAGCNWIWTQRKNWVLKIKIGIQMGKNRERCRKNRLVLK